MHHVHQAGKWILAGLLAQAAIGAGCGGELRPSVARRVDSGQWRQDWHIGIELRNQQHPQEDRQGRGDDRQPASEVGIAAAD